MIGPKLANCWSIVVPRWPTVGNFRLDAKLAEEKGPALRSSESCSDTLQIKGIATPTISQTVANPSFPVLPFSDDLHKLPMISKQTLLLERNARNQPTNQEI